MKTIKALLLTALLAPALVACAEKAPVATTVEAAPVTQTQKVLTDDKKLTIVNYEFTHDGTFYQEETAVEVMCLSNTANLIQMNKFGPLTPKAHYYKGFQKSADLGNDIAFAYGTQVQDIAQTAIDQVCN